MSPAKSRNCLLDAGDNLEDVVLTVNKDYAARLEHNKQREAWHRLKEKNPRLAAQIEAKASAPGGAVPEVDDERVEESSSEEEGESEEEDGPDLKFLSVLSRIRQRDSAIYDSNTRIYEEESSEDEQEEGGPVAVEKEKRTYLKDVLAQQALSGHGKGSEDDEEDDGDAPPAGPTYVEKQEEYRQAFLQEAGKALHDSAAEDAFGGVLTKKKKKSSELVEDGDTEEQDKGAALQTQALLDSYFGRDEKLDHAELFLKDYIRKQKWREDDEAGAAAGDADIDEDEEYLEQADKFEAQYNFRFEEAGAGTVNTYPRNLEGIVRKKDDRRRAAREARAERKAAEAAAQKEEIKRVKAHKRRELQTRLARIKDASGSEVANNLLKDILGKADFDMEEYDKAMAAAFDDSYYEAEDEDLGDPAARAVADKADDDAVLPALPPVPELDEEDGGHAAVSVEQEKQELAQLVEDYHKINAEDFVAGIPCRFHYCEVPAESYGMSILDVLAAPDKDLNQVVGMKRLAPYREDGGLTRPNYSKLRELQVTQTRGNRKQKNRGGAERMRLEIDRPKRAVTLPAAGNNEQPSSEAAGKQSTKALATSAGSTELLSAQPKPNKEGKRRAKKQNAADMPRFDGPPKAGKRKAEVFDGAGKVKQKDAKEARLATFAPPTLGDPTKKKSSKKKKAKPESNQAQAAAEANLTKAQKKNLWRKRRREAMRSGSTAAAV